MKNKKKKTQNPKNCDKYFQYVILITVNHEKKIKKR